MKSIKTLVLTCMLIPSLSAISFNVGPLFEYLEKHKEEVVDLSQAAAAMMGAGLLVEYAIKKVGYDTTYSYLGLAYNKVKSFFVNNK